MTAEEWNDKPTGSNDGRADTAPLAALAMRDAAASLITDLANHGWHDDAEAIRALPLPDDAAMLAAALRLPEIAALVVIARDNRAADVRWGQALAALEARHE